jgi:hypothetical protein
MRELRGIQEKLELDILEYEERVVQTISRLSNYSQSTDLEIRYLSKVDIEEGIIDISKLQNGSRLLDLTTGEIS